MTIIAILFTAFLLYFTLSPLGDEISPEGEEARERERSAELESALSEIIDLESDLDTGKISKEDYARARSDAEKRAAKHLDKRGKEGK